MITLLSPNSLTPLSHDTPHSVAAADERWPVVDGIPFLRLHRDALRRETLAALDAHDEEAALALLLADQDDYAPLPPPDEATCRALMRDADATFRQAMAALNFGPVADYFAHRWSAPTFLSGLALIALYAAPHKPLVEVCCGTGQLLREFQLRGGVAIGVDQVFAKLWLGKRYLGLSHLVCADAQTLPVDVAEGATTLIHDALYFIPDADKPLVIAAMERVAAGAPLLAGHLHVADHPHGGDRAHPLSIAEWQTLLRDAALFDDLALTDWFVRAGEGGLGLHDASTLTAAVCLAAGHRRAEPLALWEPSDAPLVENPLLAATRAGGLAPAWPSEAFAREYADATYLAMPDPASLRAMGVAERHARRALLPLPPRW